MVGWHRSDSVKSKPKTAAHSSAGVFRVHGLHLIPTNVLPIAWGFRSILLDVTPFDALVFGTVLGVLLCAGALGCLGPALRATRIDPLAALTVE